MSTYKPYYTSDDLIESIKNRVAIPVDQITYSDTDILRFANEEMFISQIPSIIQYHEEYFVEYQIVPIKANKDAYDIPTRAIGMRLRDVFYSDNQIDPGKEFGNLVEMTRIDLDDLPYWQSSSVNDHSIAKFMLKGNKVVLIPGAGPNPTGYLVFSYFMRPNQLVPNDRAAIIESFTKLVTVNNATLSSGDTLSIGSTIFEAGVDFAIGGSSIITASNLVGAINASGIATASNGSPSSAQVIIDYDDVTEEFLSSSTGMVVDSRIALKVDQVPSHFAASGKMDLLQTLPGHRTKKIDTTLQMISSDLLFFNSTDIDPELIIGDYVCSANEAIIPQIPPDLHNGLAERASARILASLGDLEGLEASNQKIAEIEARQATLLDQRVDGAPIKISSRTSVLGVTKRRFRRRF